MPYDKGKRTPTFWLPPVPLLDFDDFYPWDKSFTPFTPPHFAIRQIDKIHTFHYGEIALKQP